MHVNRHPFTLFLPGVSLRAVLRVEGLQDDAVHRPLRCQSRGRVELEHRARGRRRQILQRCLRRARHAVRVLGNSHRAMKASFTIYRDKYKRNCLGKRVSILFCDCPRETQLQVRGARGAEQVGLAAPLIVEVAAARRGADLRRAVLQEGPASEPGMLRELEDYPILIFTC